ncbi:MAG: GreA/GreB family elongation factor [Verrucomicrobia bacterium]|nr:GreA/GreB family elongation factor [Verrucomicrobiota bacterium]
MELQMSYLKDFLHQIAERDYPAFLRLWEEYCASDEIDPQELFDILKATQNSEFGEPFGKYVEKILPLWEKLPEGDAKHSTFKLIIDLQTINNEELRQRVFDYIQKRWTSAKHFNDKLRLVGLRGKEFFQGAVSHFELLDHMEKGKFVFHTGGWGVGEIMDVSFIREQLSVEFENVPGKKDLSFANAFKTLIPIANDHFLAMRFGNADLLEGKAKENPVEIVRILLRDLGPKTAAEIKNELCELVIPEDEWAKWWQGARGKIKKDTIIETPEDLQGQFVLRRAEVSHEERFLKALESKPDVASLTAMVYAFLRDFPETLKNPDFKSAVQAKIEEALALPDLTEAQHLQLLFLLEDVSGQKGNSKVAHIIQNAKSLEALVQSIEIHSLKKRTLMAIRKIRPDWKELFLNLLFTAVQNPLRDYLFTELLSTETLPDLKRKLEDLWVHPARFPELFIWYFQKITSDPKAPYADKEGKCRFLEGFFVLLSHLEQTGTQKELVKKMNSLLTAGRYATIRDIFQGASLPMTQEFLLLATKCHSLSDHDIKILHSLAEVVHPSLRKKSESSAENNVVWTTEEGFKKAKERMEQIATVEMIETAKEIEAARALGDLKENAEFKAALAKRDRLQSELKSLSELANKVRVLTEIDVSTDEVGIGSIVECKNKKGKVATYTLLGPWDADPDQFILSFQSKLAQSMKGLKVGQNFQFQGEEFTITAIRSYFKK